MKLLDDAGDDTHREIDDEECAEELYEFLAGGFPFGAPRPDIAGFEQCHKEGEPERHRDKEEVVSGRNGELPSRQ